MGGRLSPELHDVDNDGVRLRVLDHGGDGPPVVAMPGAGGNLRNWDAVARRLDGRVRLVSMDIRAHGGSDVVDDFGPAALVSDVEAVVAALDLGNPVVAGHSLGGMIAAFYGEAHPECPMAVNGDGHGRGGPAVPAHVRDQLQRLTDEQLALVSPPAPGGDVAWLEDQLATARAATEAVGGRWDRVEPGIRHSFVEVGVGRWERRPTFEWMTAVMQPELERWVLFDLYRRVECPLTIFSCQGTEGSGVPPELMRAVRDAIDVDLAQLVAERPNVRVIETDTTHQGLMFQGAGTMAEVLLDATTGV